MARRNEKHGLDGVILLFLFAWLLFASPMVDWWTAAGAPWYLPYALWLVVIGLCAWLQHRRDRHDV